MKENVKEDTPLFNEPSKVTLTQLNLGYQPPPFPATTSYGTTYTPHTQSQKRWPRQPQSFLPRQVRIFSDYLHRHIFQKTPASATSGLPTSSILRVDPSFSPHAWRIYIFWRRSIRRTRCWIFAWWSYIIWSWMRRRGRRSFLWITVC